MECWSVWEGGRERERKKGEAVLATYCRRETESGHGGAVRDRANNQLAIVRLTVF